MIIYYPNILGVYEFLYENNKTLHEEWLFAWDKETEFLVYRDYAFYIDINQSFGQSLVLNIPTPNGELDSQQLVNVLSLLT